MFRLGFSKDLIALILIFTIILFNNQKIQAHAIAIDQSIVKEQSLVIQNQSQNNNSVNIDSLPSETSSSSKTTTTTVAPQISFDPRRPIWNLAHMVNSIKELDYRLSKGANGVEVDVTFSKDGNPLYTYHGPPCDCWRHCHQQENFNDYLKYIRQIAIEEYDGVGKNLSLLFLDLKLDYLDNKAKAKAGIELARSIVNNLLSPSSHNSDQSSPKIHPVEGNSIVVETTSEVTNVVPKSDEKVNSELPRRKFNLIISINHVTDVELIYNFLYYLEQNNSTQLLNRIGFDVGMNDDIQFIEKMWKKFKNTVNIWQGDGYTNCFSPFYNLERLSKSIEKRDNDLGYPSKVYHWTIDLHDRMRESLRMGVDAIMTNHPERLISILKEPDMIHNFRLANENDDPFKKITKKSNAFNIESARYQRSPVSHLSRNSGGIMGGGMVGGLFGNLFDVVSSWFAYLREIPLFSFPTTTRFIPKVKRHKSTTTTMLLARNDKTQNNQPEGRVVNAQQTILYPATTTKPTLKEQSSLDNNNTDEKEIPYDGPKWYTSVASSILVSMLKIVMPVST